MVGKWGFVIVRSVSLVAICAFDLSLQEKLLDFLQQSLLTEFKISKPPLKLNPPQSFTN